MPQQIVFIQSLSRSGTTWLGTLLGSHSEVYWAGEFLYPDIFNYGFYQFLYGEVQKDPTAILTQSFPSVFLRYIEDIKSTIDKRIFIFDLKLEQLFEAPTLASAIHRPENSFIILVRENLLKLVISEAIMAQRARNGESIHSSATPPILQVSVAPELVIERMRDKQELLRKYSRYATVSGARTHRVSYESLISENQSEELDKICEFCGLPRETLSTDLVRQNPFPFHSLVENWRDLKAAIEQTEFSYTLFLPE